MQDQLSRQLRDFKCIAKNFDALFAYLNPEGQYLYINEAYSEWFNIPMEESIGKHVSETLDEQAYSTTKHQLEKALRGERVVFSNSTQMKNGTTLKMNIVLTPQLDQNKQVYGIFVLISDKQELVLIGDDGTSIDANYFAGFSLECSSNSVLCTNDKASIIFANDAACEKLDFTREELISMTMFDIDPSTTKQLWPMFWENLKNRKQLNIETLYRTKDGRELSVEVQSNFMGYHGKEYNFIYAREISKQKFYEERLHMYEKIVSSSSDCIFFIDDNYTYSAVNKSYQEAYNYKKEELVGYTLTRVHGEKRFNEIIKPLIDKVLQGETIQTGFWLESEKLQGRYIESTHTPYYNENNKITGVIIRTHDVTETKNKESDDRLASTIFNNSSEAIVVINEKFEINKINPAFTIATEYTQDEIINQHIDTLLDIQNQSPSELLEQAKNNGKWSGELIAKRKSNYLFPITATITALNDKNGINLDYFLIFNDISQKKQDEQKIWNQANFDPLTKLPNRTFFQNNLSMVISQARSKDEKACLIMIDLDQFKWVNDTLGHQAGDSLIVETSSRLKNCVRDSDVVARLGGDEFTITLTDFQDQTIIRRIADEILRNLAEPYYLENNEVYVSASIGITIFPSDGRDVKTLLQNADAAMFRAKEQGRDCYQFFTPDINQVAIERVTMERELRQAIHNKELQIFYQPIIKIEQDEMAGAEALIRWHHPEKGIIEPSEFLPLAEETGLIKSIGKEILKSACEQTQKWHKTYSSNLKIFINISTLQFRHHDFFDFLNNIEHETGLNPEYIILEITESFLLEGDRKIIQILNDLRKKGLQFSLDDFGTGYSSLAYLRKFPIDSIKIDESYIQQLTDNKKDEALIEAIISMCHNLDLQVIAEGVETKEQLDILENISCDMIQGFYLYEPLSKEEFEMLLQTDYTADIKAIVNH